MARPFLKSGGGHRAAAGITFELSRLAFVKGIFTKYLKSQLSSGIPSAIEVDGVGAGWVPDKQALGQLEPFGQAWPDASVAIQSRLDGGPQCFGEGHWKLRLKEMPHPIVWFFAEEKFSNSPPKDGQILNLAISPQDHAQWGRSWRVDALLSAEGTP
jgi:single-stranded-DNA-specific exonuclease